MNPATYAKAIVGALVAGLGSLYQALDHDGVSAQEWVAVAIATLGALGVVWAVPNRDPDGGEDGAADTTLILLVCILVAVLLVLFGVRF